MAKRLKLIGRKFGQLTVIKDAGNDKHNWSTWECLCTCGRSTVATAGHLTSGHTTSCGCRQGSFKHGQSRTKRINGVTREYKLWNAARSSSKQRGLICTIKLSDIYIPPVCPLLGIPLDRNAGLRADNKPSLDRIDSNLGYTPDNVWVISWRANKMKSEWNVRELKTLVENLEHALIERKIHEDRK